MESTNTAVFLSLFAAPEGLPELAASTVCFLAIEVGAKLPVSLPAPLTEVLFDEY